MYKIPESVDRNIPYRYDKKGRIKNLQGRKRRERLMILGFIGAGYMGKAIMKGILASGAGRKEDILAADLSDKARDAAKALGVQVTTDNVQAAGCDIVFLSIKPQFYQEVITSISPVVTEKTCIVTIAPGWTLEKLTAAFGKDVKIIRTMPNTPAMVGEGMTAVCHNPFVTPEELEYVCSLLRSFGKCAIIPERLMDAVVSVSGSSPAYVYIFIEALADGAVRDGMPRDMAYEFAAQAVLGSAKMVLETGLHPGALKDMVCSPGGTTIEAVRALEAHGFRSAVLEAMEACSNKAKGM